MIKKIHNSCRIGLLTNMYPGMFSAIKKRGILPDIEWDAIVDSGIVGLQKPDPRIFELAEQKAGAKGKEILFVENSPGNIIAASDYGWQTFLYDSAAPEESSRKLGSFF